MAEYGNPFGVDRLLDLSTMGQEYTNMRMGRANALRGLTKLGAVSAPNTQLAANLRGLGTATHKDITARLTDRMLGQGLDNEDQFRGRYKLLFGEDYNEFYDEVIKNWREQVRLGISQASEERAIRDQAIQELELAQKQKLWPLNVESKEQAIAKEKKDVEKRRSDFLSKSIAENYASIAVREIEDYKKDHDGQIPHSVREKIISDNGVDVVRGRGDEDEYESRIQAIYGTRDSRTGAEETRKTEAIEANTQEFVDLVQSLRLGGYGESTEGLSNEAAWNNALIEFGGRPINEDRAIKLLGYSGIDVLPPTTKHMFDTATGQPVTLSERDLRGAETGRYIQGADAGGKMTVPWMEAGMALLYPKPVKEGEEVTKPQITEEQFWHYYNNLFRAGKGGGIRPGEEALIGLWFNKVLLMQETKAKTLGDILGRSNI